MTNELNQTKKKNVILFLITISGIIAVFFMKPISQDPFYHSFADKRCIQSIPNFWNVVSNMPLLLIGLFGMFFLYKNYFGKNIVLFLNKFVLFFGIFLTGIGSSFYHLDPSNETLLWDRLPMTISFMSFFSIIIGEFICEKSGKNSLFPLLILGFLSIIYWQMTEKRGFGDLRFYALIQFLPLILIPIILILFKTNENSSKQFWFIIATYIIAKLLESSDAVLFHLLNLISGHSLKHVSAALGPFLFLIYEIRKLQIIHGKQQ